LNPRATEREAGFPFRLIYTDVLKGSPRSLIKNNRVKNVKSFQVVKV
jgi:hypothetical protein